MNLDNLNEKRDENIKGNRAEREERIRERERKREKNKRRKIKLAKEKKKNEYDDRGNSYDKEEEINLRL